MKWSGGKKKEKKKNNFKKTFLSEGTKEILAASDKYSYYNQELLKYDTSVIDEKHLNSSLTIVFLKNMITIVKMKVIQSDTKEETENVKMESTNILLLILKSFRSTLIWLLFVQNAISRKLYTRRILLDKI